MQTNRSQLVPAFEPEVRYEIPELTILSEDDLRFHEETLAKDLPAEHAPSLRAGIPSSALND